MVTKPRRGVLRSAAGLLVASTIQGESLADDRNNFREDVFACEEAVAWLEQCCPSFDEKSLHCIHDRHKSGGCGVYTYSRQDPAFTLEESACILDRSCEALVNAGICGRAASARGATSSSSSGPSSSFGGSTFTPKTAPVCP
jgi:hypothetical protein